MSSIKLEWSCPEGKTSNKDIHDSCYNPWPQTRHKTCKDENILYQNKIIYDFKQGDIDKPNYMNMKWHNYIISRVTIDCQNIWGWNIKLGKPLYIR